MSIPQTRGRTREKDVQQQRWGDLSVESRGHWRKSRESSPDPSHERTKENRRVDFTKRDDNIIPPVTERISYAAAVSRPPKPNVMSTGDTQDAATSLRNVQLQAQPRYVPKNFPDTPPKDEGMNTILINTMDCLTQSTKAWKDYKKA